MILCGCNLSVNLRGQIKDINSRYPEIGVLDNISDTVLNNNHILVRKMNGEDARRYLDGLNLDWSSTGYVTYKPSLYQVWYDHGYIWVYDRFLIVGNNEDGDSQRAEITEMQSLELKNVLGINKNN